MPKSQKRSSRSAGGDHLAAHPAPLLRKIKSDWAGMPAVIAATGPSLTARQAETVAAKASASDLKVVVVNDAYRLFPFADILYACDARWWDVHKGCPDFRGEKWSSHSLKGSGVLDDKRAAADAYGLNLVGGVGDPGFSFDPEKIHYGRNSGFQAVNLALLLGANPLILIGFDMRGGKKNHFFGNHPEGLRQTVSYTNFIESFRWAAKRLPEGIKIFNATPDSALDCFPKVSLNDALAA